MDLTAVFLVASGNAGLVSIIERVLPWAVQLSTKAVLGVFFTIPLAIWGAPHQTVGDLLLTVVGALGIGLAFQHLIDLLLAAGDACKISFVKATSQRRQSRNS